jgi:hypothetical protein
MNYSELLARKLPRAQERGIKIDPGKLLPSLFDYQTHCTEFSLRVGSSGIYLDTGLGKTAIELAFGQAILRYGDVKRVLMLTPLAVSQQAKREADKLGVDDVHVIRDQREASSGINICNYDRILSGAIDPAGFDAIVLDEASILKSFTGKTTRALIDGFAGLRWRMAATATPAPNDHMELGQQAEFLGVMPSNEMLMRWFIADQTAMGKYRLKRHGENDFWDWMASWSRLAQSPEDLGFDGTRFVLPGLRIHRHSVDADVKALEGTLFSYDISATGIHKLKRQTTEARADLVAQLVNAEPDESWVIWCDTDYEADALRALLPSVGEVRGSHSIERKEETLSAFASGQISALITKPSICGFGLNWQHAARMVFIGRSFSYESWYQAVRRCWRFGQSRPVDVHIAVADGEDQIGRVINRKSDDHIRMKAAMRAAMLRSRGLDSAVLREYEPNHMGKLPQWLRSAA